MPIGVGLGVCQQNRYEPRMLWLIDFIKEHGVKSGLGIVSWKRDAKYYASGPWRGKIIEEGGGVMINQALHTLDLLQHLCGMPTHVTAHTSNDYHKDCIEVEDTATAHFELPDGMMCHFYGTTAATADLPVQLQFVTMDKVRVIAGNDFVLLNGKPVEIEDTRDHANLVDHGVDKQHGQIDAAGLDGHGGTQGQDHTGIVLVDPEAFLFEIKTKGLFTAH